MMKHNEFLPDPEKVRRRVALSTRSILDATGGRIDDGELVARVKRHMPLVDESMVMEFSHEWRATSRECFRAARNSLAVCMIIAAAVCFALAIGLAIAG